MSAENEYVYVWMRHFGDSPSAYDCDGRLILFREYGQYTECGWHIDHTRPEALGGLDVYANKRPRHWRGNCGDGALIAAILRDKFRKK